MSRTYMDPHYRAPGRPASNKRVAQDANAWAEKMRREREAREASQQPAPVTIKAKEPA